MQQVNPVQTNFSAGELSPYLLGRTDIERYFSGAECIENMIVRHQGPLEKRMGTRRIAPTDPSKVCPQNPSKVVRLMEFVFSRKDAVALEISEGKFRFIYRGKYLEQDGVPCEVSVIYGTTNPVPYTNDDINDLQVTQSADVLFITHPKYPPATLSRYNLVMTDWRYELMPLANGPYMPPKQGDDNVSVTVYGVDDRMNLSSTNAEFARLKENDCVQYCDSGAWVIAKVLQVVDAKNLVVQPLEDFCLQLTKTVYCVGQYTAWDSANGVPTLVDLPAIPEDAHYTGIVPQMSICFSATSVITQEHLGKYLRFMDAKGSIYWFRVEQAGNILQQGAYGILATGYRMNPYKPTGYIAKSNRVISARLKSSVDMFSVSNDVGRFMRLVMNDTVIHAVIKADSANTASDVKVTINRTLPISASDARAGTFYITSATTNDWRRGSFFIGNYPAAITIHEERLCFGGTYVEPQTGWMSKSGDFYNFASTEEDLAVMDDSAVTFTIASDTVNQILWMVSRGSLIVGTVATEHKVTSGASSGAAITPSNVTPALQTSYGSEGIKPIAVGKAIIYAQRSGIKMRQMGYDFSSDTYTSLDLTEYSNHILKDFGGAKQMSYQLTPESIIYVRLGNGQVAAFTYESDQQVYAWTRIKLGGTGAKVESIACIPEDTYRTGFYRLYMVVSRLINGTFIRTVEVMEPTFQPTSDTDWSEFFFMDGIHQTTFYGDAFSPSITLAEFAGEDISLVYYDTKEDGTPISVASTMTVPTTGIIPFIKPDPRTSLRTIRVSIGYRYRPVLKTFPIEAQGLAGTAQGKLKRTANMVMRVINTLDFQQGLSLTGLREERTPRANALPIPPMYSGDVRIPVDNGIDTRASIYITQDKPYPLSILSLMPEVTMYQ